MLTYVTTESKLIVKRELTLAISITDHRLETSHGPISGRGLGLGDQAHCEHPHISTFGGCVITLMRCLNFVFTYGGTPNPELHMS